MKSNPLQGSRILPALTETDRKPSKKLHGVRDVFQKGLSRKNATFPVSYSITQKAKTEYENHMASLPWTHVLTLTTRKRLNLWALRYLLQSFFTRLQAQMKKNHDSPKRFRLPYHVVIEWGEDVGFHAHVLMNAPGLSELVIDITWELLQGRKWDEEDSVRATYCHVIDLTTLPDAERIHTIGYALKWELIYSNIDANYDTTYATDLVESKATRSIRKTMKQRKPS